MKLLQTLVEAVASKSQMAAQAILGDQQKLDFLASMSAQHLKKTFGGSLMDTPMAMIVQHTRGYLDATMSTRLNKDDLEQVTRAVVGQLRSHLGESKVEEEDEELTEGKMAELDDDLTSMSSEEFKKKYDCSKKEMRKKASGDGKEEKVVKEAVDTVHGVMAQILDETLDAYDVMVSPKTPGQRAAAKIIQRMYDSHTEGTGLHADDDVETIMLSVYEDIETQYGEYAGQSPFESVQESDDLTELSKNAVRGYAKAAVTDTKANLALKTKYAKSPQVVDDANRQLSKRSAGLARALTRMDEDVEEGEEELEEATRGRPRKNPPKEETTPAKRGRPSKQAAEDKPAAKKDDSDDEDTKKVSSKALAKSMEKDDDGDEDGDVEKADKASKDAPKKIADTSVKPDQLKTAYAKLSKQIQHAVDTSSATSAFELSKELRATFKDITTDEVKQATAIWKSEN